MRSKSLPELQGYFQDRKVLVVGGRGFIGRVLVEKLQSMNAKVISIGVNRLKEWDDSFGRHLIVDLLDVGELKRHLKPCPFDYVFNLGGYIDHSPYFKGGRSVIDVHYTGTLNLIDSINTNYLRAFVQVGSSDEYGCGGPPQSEDQPEMPISPYSAAKVGISHFIRALARAEGFPGVVARLFLVYGPGQECHRFIPQVIRGCINDEDFPASQGEQLRDFCYVDDVVFGLLLCAVEPRVHGQVINIASGRQISIRSVVQMIVRMTGGGKPRFGAHPYRPMENMALYANVEKAKIMLGWQAETSLNEGLRITIEWYRARP